MRTFKEYLEIIKESKEPKQNNNAPSTNRIGITDYAYVIYGDSQKPLKERGNLQEIKEMINAELQKKSFKKTFKVTIYGMDITEFRKNIDNEFSDSPYDNQKLDKILRLDKNLSDSYNIEKTFKKYLNNSQKSPDGGTELIFDRPKENVLSEPSTKSPSNKKFLDMKKKYFD